MRIDVAVYNEATGFTIQAAGSCGKPRDSIAELDVRTDPKSPPL
jgi:hypothetical protein